MKMQEQKPLAISHQLAVQLLQRTVTEAQELQQQLDKLGAIINELQKLQPVDVALPPVEPPPVDHGGNGARAVAGDAE